LNLLEIRDWLVEQLAGGAAVEFEVVDPGLGAGLYGGEEVRLGGRVERVRGYRCWVDLAELLGCRMVIPRGHDATVEVPDGFVRLRFEPLDPEGSFHDEEPEDPTEKYGTGSRYAHIDKLEEPSYLFALEAALRRVDLAAGARVLDLGVNTGDELELLRRVTGDERFGALELVGVDHSATAVARATERFGGDRRRLLVHDINRLAELDLGRFDLLLSVATLHSPSIHNAKQLFMQLVRDHLTPTGAVILAFPNCRWHGGEVLYGARPPNYNHPELSVVLKDVDWCKRYLQQHSFRVTVTGRHYLFVTATRI
jgi:SAM-dependent methyltransferase